MQEISWEEYLNLPEGTRPPLLDIREEHEREAFHVGGQWIPLSEINNRLEEIETQQPLIVYCRKGIRSALLIQRLQEKGLFHNLINLKGGIYHLQHL